ncbi:MAG: helix-turn-helix domain-containing protein [Chloroflexi bacterium]|nr:helix-turn-helix domain-containing protein [Chloroflexota bacterium]
MRLLDNVRKSLGISQSELARRMAKSQPTVARLLRHGENPTLVTLAEVLHALGLRGRLVIEEAEPGRSTLTVSVAGTSRDSSAPSAREHGAIHTEAT